MNNYNLEVPQRKLRYLYDVNSARASASRSGLFAFKVILAARLKTRS